MKPGEHMMPDEENAVETKAEGGIEEPGEMGGVVKSAQSTPDHPVASGADETPASPEEQRMYDTMMSAALRYIYDKQRIGMILQKFVADAEQDLSKAVGMTAANITRVIERSMKQDSKEVPEDVLFNVGADIVSELMEVAVAAGICPEDKRDAVSEAAVYEGLRQYGISQEDAHEVTPEKRQEYTQTLGGMGIQQNREAAGGAPTPPGQAAPNAAPPSQTPQGQAALSNPQGIVQQGVQ